MYMSYTAHTKLYFKYIYSPLYIHPWAHKSGHVCVVLYFAYLRMCCQAGLLVDHTLIQLTHYLWNTHRQYMNIHVHVHCMYHYINIACTL